MGRATTRCGAHRQLTLVTAHTCDSLTVKTESSEGHHASRHMDFVVSFSTGARLSVQNVLLCQALDVVIHPSAPCFEGSPPSAEPLT